MSTPDFTVIKVGKDVYGRPVYMTRYYRDWEQARWDALGFSLPYAQGAFMAEHGGGAEASSGAHDLGGCIDYMLTGLSQAKQRAVVKEFRLNAGAANRRDRDAKHGGMPPHLHNTLGSDKPLAPMAKTLWSSYVGGGDGLGAAKGRPGNAPDYEWRPNPLVLTPPKEKPVPPSKTPNLDAAVLNLRASIVACQAAYAAATGTKRTRLAKVINALSEELAELDDIRGGK